MEENGGEVLLLPGDPLLNIIQDQLCSLENLVSTISIHQLAYAKDVPHRVFAKGKEIPGLAMSRSIGDLAGHMAGVIHQSFPQWV